MEMLRDLPLLGASGKQRQSMPLTHHERDKGGGQLLELFDLVTAPSPAQKYCGLGAVSAPAPGRLPEEGGCGD